MLYAKIFCEDLLRLATFTKDTIDSNKLQAALTFQIHGFNITFFLSRWNVSYAGNWPTHISPLLGKIGFLCQFEEHSHLVDGNRSILAFASTCK
jgi:hypothetical protein